MMNKKRVWTIVIIIAVLLVLGFVVYSNFITPPGQNLGSAIKSYIGIYFLSSKVNVPVNAGNSTKNG